ncbi:hypothetical protein MPSEU_000082500 [Mayamaea pseudoterrestris]|nr:hypothetical protein MPSEU_000082500 [Mayamaea pseudoterrestris]
MAADCQPQLCQRMLHVVLFSLILLPVAVESFVNSGNLLQRRIRSPFQHPSPSSLTLTVNQFSSSVGESILDQVQWINNKYQKDQYSIAATNDHEVDTNDPFTITSVDDASFMGAGIGRNVYASWWKWRKQEDGALDVLSIASNRTATQLMKTSSKDAPVWEALATLENDMQVLDRMAAQKPQLSAFEFAMLSGAVLSAASGPLILGGTITNFLAPSMAAFIAAIGIGAEYTGKVAVADSKEVAAVSIQCAAEAESFLAAAERAKAITPVCVGVGATAASFSLLVPVLLDTMNIASNLQRVTEIYLFCPLISLLAAAVADLSLQETKSLAARAIGVGNRRFARSGLVSRTWMSSTELIERKSSAQYDKWVTFSLSVLPAPIIGALVPGALPTKTIVVTALAACETAYFLAASESVVSRATDAVALKARSAAVCDTYANQGARSAAILPFTSALSGLCAAATAALVELPFIDALSSANNPGAILLHMGTVAIFPALSALFAAAASVSKARCEVDAQASVLAASTIAVPYDDEEQDPLLRPFAGVLELITVTVSSSLRMMGRATMRRNWPWSLLRRWWTRRIQKRRNGQTYNDGDNATPALA